VLFWTVATTNIIFSHEHYIGLAFLVITAGLFIRRHKMGVLALGLSLILGVFKLLSYSAVITFYSLGGSLNGQSSGELKIQPIFLLWLLIYLMVSGRHFVGMLTKQYWRDLFNGSINKHVDKQV
jgi:hypothetical protein